MVNSAREIIKALPFDEAFKKLMLDKYDSLDADQKYNTDCILWDAYDALYELKLNENLVLAFQQIKEGKERIDKEFYKRVREQTELDMQSEKVKLSTDVDLSQVRNQLQEILNPSNEAN